VAKVLVVDDDPAVRVMADIYLTDAGYTVIQEASSYDVLNAIRTQQPDVVVLDVLMPGRTAVEIMADLAREPNPPPVILYTGTLASDLQVTPSMDEFLSQMYRLGVVRAVAKEQSPDGLVAAVAYALTVKRSRDGASPERRHRPRE
jgi:CheY-like chemotaxis protein